MKKNPVLRQNFVFSVLFLMGANLLIGSSYRAEQDTWVSMVIATAITVLFALILSRISYLQPEKDIFSLLKMMPKWIAYPLITLIVFYCFEQATITLRVYTGFVHIVSLPNTGIIVLPILTGLVVLYLINREDRVLFQFSYMTAIPIVFIVFLLVIFLAPMLRLENLLPICYDNTGDVALCSLENLAFPFGNIFLLLGIPYASGDSKKERNTWLLLSLSAGILSLIVVLQNILLLGGRLSNFLDFPYNYAASLVNVGDFFSRIEVFASLFFFLSAIVRTAYFMKLTLRGIQSIIPVNPRPVSVPLIALLCFYSVIAFDNTNSVFNYLKIFPYLALPLQIGLPIFLLCYLSVQKKRNERTSHLTPKMSHRMF